VAGRWPWNPGAAFQAVCGPVAGSRALAVALAVDVLGVRARRKRALCLAGFLTLPASTHVLVAGIQGRDTGRYIELARAVAGQDSQRCCGRNRATARCVGLWRVETGLWPSYASGGVSGRQTGRWAGIWACFESGPSTWCQAGAAAGFRANSRGRRVCAGHSVFVVLGTPLGHCVKTCPDQGICSNYRGVCAGKSGFRTLVRETP